MKNNFDDRLKQIIWEAMEMVGEKPVLWLVGEGFCDKAAKEIKAEIVASLPQEKTWEPEMSFGPVLKRVYKCDVDAWSAALQEVKEALQLEGERE